MNEKLSLQLSNAVMASYKIGEAKVNEIFLKHITKSLPNY